MTTSTQQKIRPHISTGSSLKTAVSYNGDPWTAAHELYQQLNDGGDQQSLGFVVFFCSASYDLDSLAQGLNQAFGQLPLAGCTTAGEITPDGYRHGSITAIGFPRDLFAVEATLVTQLDDFRLTKAQKVVGELIQGCRNQQLTDIKANTFALTLIDGLSSLEEKLLVTLSAALGHIPSFGGSAGDDINLANTHVYLNGAFHTRAAVIIMINTPCPFEVFTNHHIVPKHDKLVVTRADSDQRRVYELNAEPAAVEYAHSIGLTVEQLTPEVFALNPLAVCLGNEYYVRSIQQVNDDLSLTFYCAIENGIVLTAMVPGEVLHSLEDKLEKIVKRIGEPQMVIGCDCFLRRLEIEQLQIRPEASAMLQHYKVIGFNTYGEQFDGIHINQSFSGVVIGQHDATNDR